MPETSVVVEVSSDSDVTRGGEEGAAMVSVLGFADRQSDRFPRTLHLEDPVVGVARDTDRGHRFLVTPAFSIGDSAHYGNDLRGKMLPQKRLPLWASPNG
jgi:hypothetical protein